MLSQQHRFDFQVYDQLNSLAQKNPWFVQSLQKIMSSVSNQDQSLLSKLIPTTREPLTLASSSPTNGGDPAQAALILLLAGKIESLKFNFLKIQEQYNIFHRTSVFLHIRPVSGIIPAGNT